MPAELPERIAGLLDLVKEQKLSFSLSVWLLKAILRDQGMGFTMTQYPAASRFNSICESAETPRNQS